MGGRKAQWQRDYKAASLLMDMTHQRDIPGMESDQLKMSKLGIDESLNILQELASLLKMDWPEFSKPLARAWTNRRKRKAAGFEWDD